MKCPGKKWTLSGALEVRTTSGAELKKHPYGPSFARQLDGGFVYIKERVLYCPYGYSGRAEDPRPSEHERIRAQIWTGEIVQDTSDLSQSDHYDDWKAAHERLEDAGMQAGDTFVRDSGKAYKYKAEAAAFGVSLSAQSGYSTSVKITWEFGIDETRDWYLIFGRGAPPATAKIVYAYH